MAPRTQDLSRYNGLVFKTATMFMGACDLELDDMQQELWICVYKAVEKYNPDRGSPTEKAWVFGCLSNRVKDLRRTAARDRVKRRRWHGIEFVYIEECLHAGTNYEQTMIGIATSGAEVYRKVEEGLFILPDAVTRAEEDVLVFLLLGDYTRAEIATELGVEEKAVSARVDSLRRKFANLKPVSPAEAPTQMRAPTPPKRARAETPRRQPIGAAG